jgi:hypothetical protein
MFFIFIFIDVLLALLLHFCYKRYDYLEKLIYEMVTESESMTDGRMQMLTADINLIYELIDKLKRKLIKKGIFEKEDED